MNDIHSTETDDEVYVFPTSFSQQRIWFLDQLLPDNSVYNIHAAIQLPFSADACTFERALNRVAARHETLRTTFSVQDGTPLQVVAKRAALRVDTLDVTQMGSDVQNEVRRLGIEEANRPFNLRTGPLLRAALIRTAEDRSALLLTMHHIITDAWSMKLLMKEIWEFYRCEFTGEEAQVPELAIQYSDYAAWQRERLSGTELERLLGYWRSVLDGAPALDLRPDGHRGAWSKPAGGELPLRWPAGTWTTVTRFARESGVTPFMVLVAGFVIALHRRSQQDDLVIGVPVAGRPRIELEGLIGFFVNSLVLRVDASGDPTFRELLCRIREVTVAAYAHQDMPFEKLVELLSPPRQPGVNPYFQVCFQLHNEPVGAVGAAAANQDGAHLLDIHRGASVFDFSVDLWEAGDGLAGRVEYRADMFERGSVIRIMEQYHTVLSAALNEPDRPISALAMAPAAELVLTCVEWNRTVSAYPREVRIEELFRQQVQRTPLSTALTESGQSWSYLELDRWSDELASRLFEAGVREGDVVGVLMGRQPDAVAAVLGIVKAGAAYTSLDPTHPVARLSEMVRIAAVSVCIASEEQNEVALRLGLNCVSIRDNKGKGTMAVRPRAGGIAPAYVAYTSGSTGIPKGVCVPHRSIVRLVRATNYADFTERDVFLFHSPLGFDASTLEIWGALLNGGSVTVAPDGPTSVEELGQLIEERAVSVLWLTAGLFHQVVEQVPEALSRPRLVLAGGDVLSPRHVRTALTLREGRPVINGYGPTEGTTFTCCNVMVDPDEVRDKVPIGRPVSGTRVYVVDRRGEPCPIGVPGELFIAGDGLALCYINDPESTSASFVTSPSPHIREERLYRTGDIARWRGDGTVEFLGRVDRQIKVRGFRVEPAEIEHAISAHPSVGQCAVTARVDGSGEKTLVAYVEAKLGFEITGAELRAFAQKCLPAHAIPNQWVAVDSLPLNRNGKIDFSALPDPSLYIPATQESTDSTEVLSELECVVAEIWAGVLGLQNVGPAQDFFSDLGGHSLLGTQIVSRVREAFRVDLPLRSLFEGPTVAQMAAHIADILLGEPIPQSPARNKQ